MKEYPVGSVCVIVQGDGLVYEDYVGKECTIISGLADRLALHRSLDMVNIHGYVVSNHMAGFRGVIDHINPRLKKLPPDEAFDKFLNKVTEPVISDKPAEEPS